MWSLVTDNQISLSSSILTEKIPKPNNIGSLTSVNMRQQLNFGDHVH